MDRLLNPPQWTAAEQPVAEALAQGAVVGKDFDRLKAWWLYRMLYGPDPLGEKLTLFWHGHFATGYRKVNDPPGTARGKAATPFTHGSGADPPAPRCAGRGRRRTTARPARRRCKGRTRLRTARPVCLP